MLAALLQVVACVGRPQHLTADDAATRSDELPAERLTEFGCEMRVLATLDLRCDVQLWVVLLERRQNLIQEVPADVTEVLLPFQRLAGNCQYAAMYWR